MSLIKDIKHVLNATHLGMRTAPSVRQKKQALMLTKQAAMERGFNYGLQKAKMYYPAADVGVLQGDWVTNTRSATELIRNDFKRICARAEWAYRTDAIGRRAVNILAHHIVGQGNRPYPNVNYSNGLSVDGINNQLATDWERFNDEGVRNGTMRLTMYQAQFLKAVTMIVYGSVMQKVVNSKKDSLLPYAFQILKPTQLDFSKDTWCNNSTDLPLQNITIHGIQLNSFGEPVNYNFCLNNSVIPADNIDLTFYPIETEQYLGLSWLTPVLPAIYDRQQLLSDKLKMSRIAARLGMQMPRNMQEGIANLTETDDSGNSYFDLDFQGFVFSDKDIKPISITDPLTNSFKPLVDMTMYEIALGMGISYQSLSSDLQSANYSSARTNKIEDNLFYTTLYKHFIDSSCKTDWNRFVDWEVMSGRLAKYGVTWSNYQADKWRYRQAYWLPMDGEQWIDPLKDAEAMILLYKTGQITYAELCAKAGKHWKSVVKQIKSERDEIISQGLDFMLPENISSSPKAQASLAVESESESDKNADKGNQNGDDNI